MTRLYPRPHWLMFGIMIVVFTLVLGTGQEPRRGGSSPSSDGPGAAPSRWEGVASCAAQPCHGGAASTSNLRAEYSVWIGTDLHKDAFNVLYDETSEQMATLLWGNQKKAHEAAECLCCHTSGPRDAPRNPRLLSDGVGCESCHGPAGNYLAEHTEASWRQLPRKAKAARGLRDTSDVIGMASTCAGCHVGEPNREVSHRLYAAGHPRLAFDFASYFAAMPAHWQEKPRSSAETGVLGARRWSVGVALGAIQALDLLADRAENADKGTRRWPELSEFDCYACHHALGSSNQPSSPRPQAPALRRGEIPALHWYVALLPHLPTVPRAEVLQALLELRRAMAGLPPDPKRVAQKARNLIRLLGPLPQRMNSFRFTGSTVRSLLRDVAAANPELEWNWDGAAQQAYALAALHRAARHLSVHPRDQEIAALISRLQRKTGFADDFRSPQQFRASELADDLRELRTLLEE